MNYEYVFQEGDKLHSFRDKDYGVTFELPLVMLEKALGLETTRDIYMMRHLCTFLMFFISVIAFFFLSPGNGLPQLLRELLDCAGGRPRDREPACRLLRAGQLEVTHSSRITHHRHSSSHECRTRTGVH